MAGEYKALTYIELPFIGPGGEGLRFSPGDTISMSEFEKAAKAAEKNFPDLKTHTAEQQIKELTKWGSLSDDLDAPLHPDHIPVDPNVPTVNSLVAQAQFLINDLEEKGQDVPAKLRALAEMKVVTTADSGKAGEKNA